MDSGVGFCCRPQGGFDIGIGQSLGGPDHFGGGGVANKPPHGPVQNELIQHVNQIVTVFRQNKPRPDFLNVLLQEGFELPGNFRERERKRVVFELDHGILNH